MLCLEELHAISDTLSKHFQYENTKKRLTFFQFGHLKKTITQKSFKPMLNWLTVMYAPDNLVCSCSAPVYFLANRCFLTVGITSTVLFFVEGASTLLLTKQVKRNHIDE